MALYTDGNMIIESIQFKEYNYEELYQLTKSVVGDPVIRTDNGNLTEFLTPYPVRVLESQYYVKLADNTFTSMDSSEFESTYTLIN